MTVYTTACPRCGAVCQGGKWSQPGTPAPTLSPLRSAGAQIGLMFKPLSPGTLP
jgi:hypothetical protein